MATIKLGPVVAGVAGSISGVTFSRNRGGAYIRNRTKPAVPSSDRRAAANALLTQQVAVWQGLTDAQRVAFNEQAKVTTLINRLGEPIHPTGMNLFLRANIGLLNTGQSAVTAPPVPALTQSVAPTLAHTIDVGIQVTAVGEFDDSITGEILFQRSAPQPLSVYYFNGPWATLESETIATFATVPYTITANADLVVSARYFYRLVVVAATGALSSAPVFSVVTPAALTT